jgi:hypothetical protein
VVGEHGTEGAVGYAERVFMPGTITFQYTKGRIYFAGTEELNLEAKGVALVAGAYEIGEAGAVTFYPGGLSG